jgi:glycosyltransferase involved in cell wall biosynthesis
MSRHIAKFLCSRESPGQPMPEASILSSVSVVIPTYNREKVLAKALEGYRLQSLPGLIRELLIVDDGSSDGTEALVREFSRRAPFSVRYLRQINKGPAAARNYGIREAQSNLVLFTDSDIIPQRNLVEQHLEWHNQNPQVNVAVLGYVTWSPEMKATPFMRWYGEHAIFAYRLLRGRWMADFRFFYTCNLSLKTEYLRSCGQFDEDFKTAAYEDLELGYRLNQKGLQLLYNPRAFAYHHQFVSFEDACRKARDNLEARHKFEQKEAGQQWQAEQKKRAATLRFRIAALMATGVAIALGWSKCLSDSRVPLPPIVYHCLYWYRVNSLSR